MNSGDCIVDGYYPPQFKVRGVWNVPVTAADAQVGDADVSGRPGEGVTAPSV